MFYIWQIHRENHHNMFQIMGVPHLYNSPVNYGCFHVKFPSIYVETPIIHRELYKWGTSQQLSLEIRRHDSDIPMTGMLQ